MPRDGSGVMTQPFPDVLPDTTVASTVYNGFVHDVVTDLNAARPIIAGGTGATNATQARANLQAEVATAIVTNYDSQIWEPGSFYSAATATSPPAGLAHRFAGTCYGPDQNNLVLEARDLDDTNVPGFVYVREKNAGVWGPWISDIDSAIAARAVRYDIAQALTPEPQQRQARQNIYAAPFDALAYNGMQVNGTFDVSQVYGAAGVSVPNNTALYVPDQWILTVNQASAVFTAQCIAVSLPGFGGCFRIVATNGGPFTGTNDLFRLYTCIEGYRIARLGWGTASAQPITVGMYLYTSIPGKLPLTVTNFDGSRSYLTTVNVTSGYQYSTFTIPGCTDGTWKIDNGIGMQIGIGSLSGGAYQSSSVNVWGTGFRICTPDTTNFFASGANLFSLAAFGIWPGVEAPTFARLPFIMRSADQEIELCRRHLEVRRYDSSTTDINSWFQQTGTFDYIWSFGVLKRAVPVITLRSGSWAGGAPTITAQTDHALFGSAGAFAALGTSGNISTMADARM